MFLLPELFRLDFTVIGNILSKFLNPESIKKVLLYLTPSPRLSLTILNHSWNFKHFSILWRRQRLSKKPPNKLHCDYRKKRMMTKNVFRPFQLSELLSLKNVKLCDFQMRKKFWSNFSQIFDVIKSNKKTRNEFLAEFLIKNVIQFTNLLSDRDN